MKYPLFYPNIHKKDILKEILDFILSDNVKSQDILVVISSIAGNPDGLELAWDFFKNNYNKLEDRFGRTSHAMSNMTKVICSRFSSDEKIREIKNFFRDKDTENIKRAIAQSLEMIEINRNFVGKTGFNSPKLI